MRVRMEDVARQAGVSKATVSLALSGSAGVSKKTRDHVKAIARMLGYEPNSQARRLALRRSGQIGLIVPDIENVYYASLMRHINLEIGRAGYSMLSAISENSLETEEKLVRELLRNAIDAILLVPSHDVDRAPRSIERILRAGTPAVMTTSRYLDAGIPCVMCDLYEGMRALSEALLCKGRRRQMLVSTDSMAVAFTSRERGFFDALSGMGAVARKTSLSGITYEAAFDWAAGAAIAGLDAILCVNDMMALGVLDALFQRGVRVPEDIAVTGFDDVIFSRVTSTPITTVRQDLALLAKLTVDCAVSLIEGGAAGEDILIPCRTIERAST